MKMKNVDHIRINGDKLAGELGYGNLCEMRQVLERMSRMSPAELDRDELSDLTEIKVDDSLAAEEQALSLLRQTKNPYYYLYGDMIVMIGDEARDALEDFLCHCLFSNREGWNEGKK
ncbi:DUF6870 family protein [Porcincola intestinalis]|uniref:DUF6870 domain-containing protein n=1 Tax=Porcincola intestinalis TaxID=2606632 RepID=A0A6L5X619_9FIRM|nr:hypothetical protein [Porcincola intestinalis]MSS13802.1 hypothetical protein [Porcincola intestinalis]